MPAMTMAIVVAGRARTKTDAKRIASRADDEDEECAGGERLNEPTGMEESFRGTENLEQRKECQDVVDGINGANMDDEIADHAHVPTLRFVNECPVDVICGDRHLRHDVEKRTQQNLRRQHRQKRQEQ